MKKEEVEKLASDHVDWFLEIIRPLLIAEFVHGYKHGKDNIPPLNIAVPDKGEK